MVAISDAEKAEIQQEAQHILKKFSVALAKVKIPKQVEKQGPSGWREEGQGREADTAFRGAMLANAPNHDATSIIAEKKSWS